MEELDYDYEAQKPTLLRPRLPRTPFVYVPEFAPGSRGAGPRHELVEG